MTQAPLKVIAATAEFRVQGAFPWKQKKRNLWEHILWRGIYCARVLFHRWPRRYENLPCEQSRFDLTWRMKSTFSMSL